MQTQERSIIISNDNLSAPVLEGACSQSRHPRAAATSQEEYEIVRSDVERAVNFIGNYALIKGVL